MCQRRIDIHGFQRDGAAAVFLLCREGAHVVQAVAELDEDDADVLRHSEQHLADVLDVRLFLVLDVDLLDLGQTVHQHGDALSEFLRDDGKAGLVGTVLHRIVQQRGADRVGVEPEPRHDLGDGDGMGDIRFAALAFLSFMQFVCVFVCRLDLLAVVVAAAVIDRVPKGLQYAVHSGVHTGFPFIGNAALRRAVWSMQAFPQGGSQRYALRSAPHSARVCVRRRRRIADLSRSARFCW